VQGIPLGTAEERSTRHRSSIQGWMTPTGVVSRKIATFVGKIFFTCR
jgi:hypothetical protein